MKNILLVVLLLLASTQCLADNLQNVLQDIETEWATIYYGTPKSQQGSAYATLLDKTVKLANQYPQDTNTLFWQAVVKASYADRQDPVSALDAIYEVRDLLNKVITINPRTINGSAYVVLGTLYHKAPAWPIAFGDDEKASKSFQAALKISPDGMDSNYYYGEFLLANNQLKEAEIYFKKASVAPVRTRQQYADTQLQNAAKQALNRLKNEHSASTTH